MEHSLIKRAVALLGIAGAVYASLFVVLGVASTHASTIVTDAGMCAVPSDAQSQGPTYFVGCGGFF